MDRNTQYLQGETLQTRHGQTGGIQKASGISLSGFDTFDEVCRGFEFSGDRSFYPHLFKLIVGPGYIVVRNLPSASPLSQQTVEFLPTVSAILHSSFRGHFQHLQVNDHQRYFCVHTRPTAPSSASKLIVQFRNKAKGQAVKLSNLSPLVYLGPNHSAIGI